MINKKILELRNEHEQAKLKYAGGRHLHSEKLKKLAVEILNSGVPLSDIAKQTGLNVSTIFKWSRKIAAHKLPLASSRFRKLRLKSKNNEETVFIILPSGIRIECSAYHQLSRILREVA